MKTDLATSILAAIVGVVVAYFVCGLFLPEIGDVSFDVLDSKSINYSLTEPNPEIFNYRAVDPVVEVYVGQCDSQDTTGNCIDGTTNIEDLEEELLDNPVDLEEELSNEDNENGSSD